MTSSAMLHEQVAELLGAYALDAVDPDELALVQAHLVKCPRCTAELARHYEVAGLLANTGADAPAGLWDRIADRLGPPGSPNWEKQAPHLERPERALDVTEEDSGSTEPLPGLHRADGRTGQVASLAHRPMWRQAAAWGATAVATAAAVLAILLGVQVGNLNHRVTQLQAGVDRPALSRVIQAALEDPSTKLVRLTPAGSPSEGGPVVTVAITSGGTAYLIPHNLASLPSDETYQLWGKFGTRLTSLGLLGADPTTTAFTVNSSARVTLFAITTEPAGGTIQPTRPPTVQGAVA